MKINNEYKHYTQNQNINDIIKNLHFLEHNIDNLAKVDLDANKREMPIITYNKLDIDKED